MNIGAGIWGHARIFRYVSLQGYRIIPGRSPGLTPPPPSINFGRTVTHSDAERDCTNTKKAKDWDVLEKFG